MSVSRRTALVGIGTSIVGTGVVSATNYEEIVTAENKSGAVETRSVPRAWLAHERASDNAHQQLLEKFGSDDTVLSIAQTVGKTEFKSFRGTQVLVEFDKTSSPDQRPEIPSEVNGINVVTKESEAAEPQSCFNSGTYTYVPGGVLYGNAVNTDLQATNFALHEYNGAQYMAQTYHDMDPDPYDFSCPDVTGETAHQNSQLVGVVEKQFPNVDLVLVSDGDGSPYYIDGVKLSSDGYNHPISAWFTKNGLKTAMSDGRTVAKQGTRTGYETGTIDSVSRSDTYFHCGGFDDGEGVACDLRSTYGDSGGPTFAFGKNDPDNLVLVGMHVAGKQSLNNTSCDGNTYKDLALSQPSYKIYSDYGVTPVTI